MLPILLNKTVMIKVKLEFLLIGLLLLSCADDKNSPSEINSKVLFEDGFETATGEINDLFSNERWSNLQQVNPSGTTNTVRLAEEEKNAGAYSLYMQAFPSSSPVSKMDIEKGGLELFENEKVEIDVWFYIEGNESLQNLTLIDLECCQCWDPDVPDNQCPGVRLQMSVGDDYLVIERGKIGLTSLRQSTTRFPRDQWVNVRWVLNLSDETDGSNQLYINEQLVIEESGINMPNQQIFAELFAQENIDFQLQTPLFYERIQFGITANSTNSPVGLYIDDVTIKKL